MIAFGRTFVSGETVIVNLVSSTGAFVSETSAVGTARSGLAAASYGGDRAVFGYGSSNSGYVSITNLVSNTGVIIADTLGVGTARSGLAAASYSS